MNSRTFNIVTTAISVLALLISSFALYFSWSQRSIDYDKAVLIQPGLLPIQRINKGNFSFDLEIENTSKSNLQYFLRVNTNMGCLKGSNGRPLFFPCGYESQIISLSKSDSGKRSYKHSLNLNAYPGAVETNPLAYISDADYFLNIEVVDASNGRLLYKSECFYGFHKEAQTFGLDQPIIDTTGESKKRQAQCRP